MSTPRNRSQNAKMRRRTISASSAKYIAPCMVVASNQDATSANSNNDGTVSLCDSSALTKLRVPMGVVPPQTTIDVAQDLITHLKAQSPAEFVDGGWIHEYPCEVQDEGTLQCVVATGASATEGKLAMVDPSYPGYVANWKPGYPSIGRFEETKTAGEYVLVKWDVDEGEKVATHEYTAAGAITVPPEVDHYIVQIKGSAALAMTLADPTAAQENLRMTIIGASPHAHSIDNSGGSGFNGAGAGADKITLTAAAGNRLDLIVTEGKWGVNVALLTALSYTLD